MMTSYGPPGNMTASQFDGTLLEYQPDEVVWIKGFPDSEVFRWCDDHEITVDLLWGGYDQNAHGAKWGLKDPHQRMIFVLRFT